MKNDDCYDMLPERRRLLLLGGALAVAGMLRGRRALAASGAMSGDMHGDSMDGDMSAHAQHEHHHASMATSQDVKRSVATYKIPALTLVRQDGTKVAFPQQLDDGRPVILDFIYTSCTAVCPVSSHIFSELQGELGKDREKVSMVSISIDPEYDTPARLTAYAKKYHAEAQWQHFTGTAQASIAMQKAFDVYRGSKMNHFPVTFLRAAPGRPWVRLEGFATPDKLLQEYRNLVKHA